MEALVGRRRSRSGSRDNDLAIREAQLILADDIHPGPHDAEKTINELLSVLDRDDVVEAVDRLEAGTGMRVS